VTFSNVMLSWIGRAAAALGMATAETSAARAAVKKNLLEISLPPRWQVECL
jgi:hypothetical protein